MGTLNTETGDRASDRDEGRSGPPPATILRTVLRSRRHDVVLSSALAVLHQTCEVLVPVTVGLIIDRAIAPGDAGAAVRWLAVLAGQFVVLSAAGCIALYVDERARREATHQARTQLARRVLDAGGGVERALPGEVVSLSTVETTRIGDGVGAVIVGIGAIAGVLAGAVILLATSIWLGLAVVVGLPIVLLIVQALAEPLVARADEHQEAVGAASGVAADLLRGLRVVKGLGADGPAAARYRTASASARRAGLAANRARSTYAGFTLTVAGGFVILVAWLGARQALDGHITVGELVAALGVTQFLVGPLGRLAYAAGELAQARASSTHLDTALQAPPAVTGGPRHLPILAERPSTPRPNGAAADRASPAAPAPAPGQRRAASGAGRDDPASVADAEPARAGSRSGAAGVAGVAGDAASAGGAHRATGGEPGSSVRAEQASVAGGPAGANGGGSGVRLGLEGVRHKGLRDVSFVVEAGELVAVVAAPAEAAALVEVLDRSADPEGGSVTVGEVPHAELTLDEARRAVTVAHHDGPLFGGSILDNVLAAVPPDVDADAAVGLLEPVIAAASLDDVLAAVDGGLEGELTDEGRSLSGGQRQRVALARALAADPPVLVLHEPTTAVDTATEHRIAAGLRSLRAGRTTLVVTASPPLLAAADRVVVVADGQVAADGTHTDLAAHDEAYRRTVLR